MKISKDIIPYIKQQLDRGRTFSSIGKELGVKAWTIQKRLGIKHPHSGRQECSYIWNIIPNYQALILNLTNKYDKLFRVGDILLDYSITMNRNEIKKLENTDTQYREYVFLQLCKARILAYKESLEFKNTSRLVTNSSGIYFVPEYGYKI